MVKSRDIIHKPRRPKLPENISIPCGPFRASCSPQTLNKGWSRNLHEIFLSGRHILPCELKAFFLFFSPPFRVSKVFFQKNSISCIDLKAECQKRGFKQWSRNAFCIFCMFAHFKVHNSLGFSAKVTAVWYSHVWLFFTRKIGANCRNLFSEKFSLLPSRVELKWEMLQFFGLGVFGD